MSHDLIISRGYEAISRGYEAPYEEPVRLFSLSFSSVVPRVTEKGSGSEEGSYLRLIDLCITQL